MRTKNFFAILAIASALTIAVVIVGKKSQAQNTSPRPRDKTGAMIANTLEVKTNNQLRAAFTSVRSDKAAALNH